MIRRPSRLSSTASRRGVRTWGSFACPETWRSHRESASAVDIILLLRAFQGDTADSPSGILDILNSNPARQTPQVMDNHEGVFNDLERFAEGHHICGSLSGYAEEPMADGHVVWVVCSCGV